MKHTPGPWTASIGERGAHINVRNDYNHPLSFGISYPDDVAEGQANARLIAAAPELLAALENILWSVNVRIDDPRVTHFDAARAAVAQATS